MPFPDELARGLAVVTYDPRWPADFVTLTGRVKAALGPMAVRVDHVGSTSVPGLAAKDCIDIQIEVPVLAEEPVSGCFAKIGFRLRPEPWNGVEATPGKPDSPGCLGRLQTAPGINNHRPLSIWPGQSRPNPHPHDRR
jgi:hypothetical protein